MAAPDLHFLTPQDRRIVKDCFLVSFTEKPRHSYPRLSSSTKARSVHLRSSPAALNQLLNGFRGKCCCQPIPSGSPAHRKDGCEHGGSQTQALQLSVAKRGSNEMS